MNEFTVFRIALGAGIIPQHFAFSSPMPIVSWWSKWRMHLIIAVVDGTNRSSTTPQSLNNGACIRGRINDLSSLSTLLFLDEPHLRLVSRWVSWMTCSCIPSGCLYRLLSIRLPSWQWYWECVAPGFRVQLHDQLQKSIELPIPSNFKWLDTSGVHWQ